MIELLRTHHLIFNKPISIIKGTNRVDMQYDVDRHLVVRKDITGSGTTTTTMLGSYEKVEDSSGTSHKLYIGDFAVVIQKSGQADKTNYFHKDHLGSTVAITDQNGAIVEYFSFDAWGKRRNVDATAAINDVQYISLSSQITNKGFTGHEQLDPVGLVHMGGRVYDPTIGRFLSADPFIQAPDSTQSYNRYSYVMNNPLSLTDPTGYFSVGGFLGSVFSGLANLIKAIVRVHLQVFKAITIKPAQWAFRQLARNQYLNMAAQAAGCYFSGPACPTVMAAMASGTAYVATDGNWAAAFTAGVTAYAMAKIAQSDMDNWSKAAWSANVGGVSSAAQGGSFKNGAIMAGLPALAGATQPELRIMLSGTASKLTGGKFVDGVKTAAFAYALTQVGQLVKYAGSITDKLKLISCSAGYGDCTSAAAIDERGVLRTDGTRDVDWTLNPGGENDGNIFTKSGMEAEASGLHIYDPGKSLDNKFLRFFITDVSKVHDWFNSWNYGGDGRYVSRGEVFDTAFQVYSFSGMPIAGAITAIGYAGKLPLERIPYYDSTKGW